MTAAGADRDIAVIREELQDLIRYLEGVPAPMRRSGAFLAYERRVGELSRELISSELDAALRDPRSHLAAAKGDLEGRRLDLSEAAECLLRVAAANRRHGELTGGWVPALTVALVCGLAAFLWIRPGATWLAISLTVILAVGLLLSLGLMWGVEVRRGETARYLILGNLIKSSFGPSGEILGTFEHYKACTKTAEELIQEIRKGAS